MAGRAAAATCERGSIRPRGPPRASTATPLRPDPLHMTASGIDGAARPRGGMGLPVEAGAGPERARPRTTGCFPDSTVLLLPGTGGPAQRPDRDARRARLVVFRTFGTRNASVPSESDVWTRQLRFVMPITVCTRMLRVGDEHLLGYKRA